MQLLFFALSLAVIQYIDHAGKSHDHGKQNGTAKSATGKADVRIEHNQCVYFASSIAGTTGKIYCATVEICPLHTICRGWFYCSAARNTVGVWR